MHVGMAPMIRDLSPLLQKTAINPHATLITLFMTAMKEEWAMCEATHRQNEVKKELKRLSPYPGFPKQTDLYSAEYIKWSDAGSFVRDVEGYLAK